MVPQTDYSLILYVLVHQTQQQGTAYVLHQHQLLIAHICTHTSLLFYQTCPVYKKLVQLQLSLLVYHVFAVLYVQYHLQFVAKLQHKELIQRNNPSSIKSTTDDNVEPERLYR